VLGFGLASMAVGLVLLSIIDEVSGYLFILLGSIVYVAGWVPAVGPATTAVMNAVPAAQAGDGSSVNQMTRRVGAAVGVAVLGTIFSSVYAARLGDVIKGLPRASVKLAESSIGGAAQVAEGLSGLARDTMLATADRAFVSAVQVAFVFSAVVTATAVVVVARTLRAPKPGSPKSLSK
jgi:hypothetical protein